MAAPSRLFAARPVKPLPEPLRPPVRRAWIAAESATLGRLRRALSTIAVRSQLRRFELCPPTRAEIARAMRLFD